MSGPEAAEDTAVRQVELGGPEPEEPEPDQPEASGPEPDEPGPVEGAEEWMVVYAEYLEQEEIYGFYIGDVNGDGFPELVTCFTKDDVTYETNSGAVCYMTEEGLQALELQVISIWGQVGYLQETNQIIFERWYGHTQGTFGSVEYFLYDWTLGGFVETYSLIRESGLAAHENSEGEWVAELYGDGYINGEEVSFDDFQAALGKMEALLANSTWFPMVIADEVDHYLEYLMEWERGGC